MNADSEKLRQSLVEQLSSFESRLDSKIDDVKLLAEIQEGIGRVLGADGGNEAEVRRVLQERYESGDLRKETFQLVKSMLDRFITEEIPTSAGFSDRVAANSSDALLAVSVANEEPADEDIMTSTTVLPVDIIATNDTADERIQVGSVLRDRFMLQERVASGAMGVVYKALDRRLAEAGADAHWVAIKVLSPQLAENGNALRALQQEAAKGRCLTHPNIVRFIDIDRDEDLYFMVMEWLEGRTLADILDSPDSKCIDRTRALEIVRQIGNALDYAHRCGIVHADVKPGNIMIMPNGDAKLFDFGVARVQQAQLQEQADFDPGILKLMTPAYSSMQVLTGEEPTPADDVFSLACLLYRLIAGYRVFGPRNAAEAAAEGMKPQKPSSLGDTQWSALKKALSYARVTRFDSMADFIAALDVDVKEPVAITAPPRDKPDVSESSGAGRHLFGLLVLIVLLGAAGWKLGLLDEVMQRFDLGIPTGVTDDSPGVSDNDLVNESIVDPYSSADEYDPTEQSAVFDPPGNESLIDGNTVIQESISDSAVDELAPAGPIETNSESAATVESDEPAGPVEEAPVEPIVAAVPLVDFSLLPPPTAEIQLVQKGSRVGSANVTLREDGRSVIIDLIRNDIAAPMTLRLDEIRHSGNRSPWASGQLVLSDDGVVEFPAGQNRGRVTLTLASDPLREADQQVTFRVREVGSATRELAIITAVLEDDDQRAFEATLPANTIAFATSQISVREQDPAVQIDVLRFNPDNTPLVVNYTLRDITATQGEDYFAPGSYSIEFGPGQRTARILIPLVQDSAYENNEAFSVELTTSEPVLDIDVYRRIAVMIRDDD